MAAKVEGVLEKARNMVAHGNYRRACDFLDATLSKCKDESELPLALRAQCHHVMAFACRKRKKFDLAYFHSMFEVKVLRQLGQTQERAFYVVVLDLTEAFLGLGKLSEAHSSYDEALDIAHDLALGQTEDYAHHLMLGGRLCCKENHWEKGLVQIARALEVLELLDKAHDTVTAAAVHHEMGCAREHLKDWAAAAESFGMALHISRNVHENGANHAIAHPETVDYASKLCTAYSKMKRTDLMLRLMEEMYAGQCQRLGETHKTVVELKTYLDKARRDEAAAAREFRQCRGNCGRPTGTREWCSQTCVDAAWSTHRRDTVQCAECEQCFATGTLGRDGKTRCRKCQTQTHKK